MTQSGMTVPVYMGESVIEEEHGLIASSQFEHITGEALLRFTLT
jgi:hypothetical protein